MIQLQRATPLLSTFPTGRHVGFLDIVETGFRHRRLFVGTAFVVVVLAALWTFATPRRYTSKLSVLVQNARATEVVSSEGAAVRDPVPDVSEEQMNSEMAVLGSTDILDQVVDLGWPEHSQSASASERSLHNRRVDVLRRALKITSPRKSHVITVSLVAPSSIEGQKTLARLLGIFLQRQRDLSHPPGALQFFTEQVERYRHDLTQAQDRLSAYQQQHRFLTLPTYEVNLEQKVLETDSLSNNIDVEIAATRQRIMSDERMLGSLTPRQTTLQRSVPSAGAIDQLNTLEVTLRDRRAELLTKFKPNDRLIEEVNKQLSETEEGLARVKNSSSAELSTDINPAWQLANTDLMQARTGLDALRARAEMLHRQAADLQSSLDKSESFAPEFSALQSRVTELDSMYQNMLGKRDAASMDEFMDAQRWLNVAVIEAPTLASTPTHPQPLIDMSLGVLSALMLASILVFFVESGRSTMALPAEVEIVTGLPVLATVPLRNDSKQITHRSAVDTHRREASRNNSSILAELPDSPGTFQNYPYSNQ